MSNKSYRVRFNFWLNLENSQEGEIANQIESLKSERLFTSTIRDGIKLITDLKEGNLEVLFELFPWVRAEFLQYMRQIASESPAEPSAKSTVPDQRIEAERAWLEAEQERLEQEREWEQRRLAEAQKALEAERRNIEHERQRIEAERIANQSSIQKQLARLEALLLSQGYQPIERPIEDESHHPNEGKSSPNRSGAPKQLSVPQFAPPPMLDDDDDLLELKKDETAAMRTTMNFISSVIGLTENNKKPPKTTATYGKGGKTRYKQTREVGQ